MWPPEYWYGCQWMGFCYEIWLAMRIELRHAKALAKADCMPFSMAAGCWSLENEQDGNVAFICTPSNWGSKPSRHAHQISKPRFQQVSHCLLLIQQQARGYTLLPTPHCEPTVRERERARARQKAFNRGTCF